MGVSGYGAPQDHSGLSGNGVGDPHKQYSLVMVGLASARPAPGTGGLRPGTQYFATDTHTQTTYDGTGWVEPGLTPAEGDRDYVRLVADNLLSGRNSFSPSPANSFPTEYEPAGTNFVLNPSFEVDTARWNTLEAAVLTRDTAQFFIGTASGRVDVATGANLNGIWNNGADNGASNAAPGETWTFSIWLRASAAKNVNIHLSFRNPDGTFIQDVTVTCAATTTWQRFSTSGVAPAGTGRVAVKVQNNNTDQGAFSFWVDGVQLERNSVATSYIDGAQGTGFAWTGTAHASTSTRAANTVLRVARDVATTNVITNPSFETDIVGWPHTTYNTPPTLSRVVDGTARTGSAYLRAQWGTATTVDGVRSIRTSAAAGQVWSGSVWVRAETGTVTGRIAVEGHDATNSSAGTLSSTATTFTASTEWQRISVTHTMPTGTATVSLNFDDGTDGITGKVIHFDGFQLEQQPSATSYADGTLGTGYAWTGTPHASTSTRAANTIIPAVVKTLPPYGLVSEGAGRNLLSNPSFEIDGLEGWSLIGGTPTSSGDAAIIGGKGLRLAVPAAAANAGLVQRVPASPGQTFTLSGWTWRTGGQALMYAFLTLSFFDSAGTRIGSHDASNHTATPRRVSVTGTAPANTTYAEVFVQKGTASDLGVYTLFADGVQLEEGTVATSYIDGSLGPGYTWEGTPHASPSRRTAGTKAIGSRQSIVASELELSGARTGEAAVGETTTSTTYVDLPTPCQTSVVVGQSGRVLLNMTSEVDNNTLGGVSVVAWTASGANTRAPDDARSAVVAHTGSVTAISTVGRTYVVDGLAPGLTTFALRYRVTGGTGRFLRRMITVVPI